MVEATAQADTADATPSSTEGSKPFIVPIAKAKDTITVNVDDLPDEVFREVMFQGLKAVLNRGMTKVAAIEDEAERKAEALEKAKANWDDMKEGKVRITGGKAKPKGAREINTEAMRLARNAVKDAIKEEGGKISHYPSSEITALAKEYLEQETDEAKQLWALAKTNVEARLKKVKGSTVLKTIAKKAKVDTDLVKKAEAKKAERKPKAGAQLSKTQAGTASHR